jgi:acyl dehydratase
MAEADIWAVGAELVPLPKTVELERLRQYSGPGRSLHSDAAAAREAGYSAPIAWGLQSAAYCSELFLRTFGAAWVTGGALRVRFRRPVLAGATLTVRAVVTERTEADGAVVLGFAVWCEDGAGTRVSEGEARVRIAR